MQLQAERRSRAIPWFSFARKIRLQVWLKRHSLAPAWEALTVEGESGLAKGRPIPI